ncbi:MAG: MFS transporter [Candidatus Promineifilaceae bacterium]|nr:MFS transporter [Candidatus Promineifilaceae bacterium]
MNTQSPSAAGEEKLDFKRILPIFVIVLVDLLGLTIIIPLLPLYATSYGADALTIGLLGAAYPIMQFVGAPILGRLSDRYGRRPVLIVSQIGTLIGFLILGLANAMWLLFLSRIIDGISGANIATAQAAISDSTTEKTRTQGLGLIGAAFGIGFIIGPVIAFVSLALSDNNFHVPAFAAAGFSAISLLLTIVWFKETLPESQRGQTTERSAFSPLAMLRALSHPTVGILLLLIFAQQLAFGGFEQLLALFTLSRLGLNASGNALVFVFVGVIVVTVQGGLIGRWSRRFGDRRLIYGGLALLTVGLTLTGLTPAEPVPWYSRQALTDELTTGQTLPGEAPVTQEIAIELPDDDNTGWRGLLWLLAAMVPAAVGGGILQPAINSLITKRVDGGDVGGLLGISAAFLSGANALAPLLGGAIFQALGPSAPFIAWGILLLILFLVALRYVRPGREETTSAGLARGARH